MKRRAILRDRKRIESKVNEARFFTGEVRVWDGLGELVPLVQGFFGLFQAPRLAELSSSGTKLPKKAFLAHEPPEPWCMAS